MYKRPLYVNEDISIMHWSGRNCHLICQIGLIVTIISGPFVVVIVMGKKSNRENFLNVLKMKVSPWSHIKISEL